jgi:hypothetical protein
MPETRDFSCIFRDEIKQGDGVVTIPRTFPRGADALEEAEHDVGPKLTNAELLELHSMLS